MTAKRERAAFGRIEAGGGVVPAVIGADAAKQYGLALGTMPGDGVPRRQRQRRAADRRAMTRPLLPVDGFEHKWAQNGEISIHYVVAGQEGTPVMLLHGFPETWYAWRDLIPLLANAHRVIAPDLRGVGESSRPVNGYEKTAIAGDVEAVVSAEALSTYHLVGADMGAAVAFPIAIRNQTRVQSFVFIASALAGFGLERLYDYSSIGVNAWYWTLFQHPEFGPMLTDGHQREMLISWAYRGSALQPDAIPDSVIEEYLRSYGTSDGWRAALQYYSTLERDARENRDLMAEHGRLRMPTLGIDGEQDGHLSTATLSQVAIDVRGTLIPECKHWVAEEQPERLAAALLDFFAAAAVQAGAGHA